MCVCVYETVVMCQECGGSAALSHSWELWAVALVGLAVHVCFREEITKVRGQWDLLRSSVVL